MSFIGQDINVVCHKSLIASLRSQVEPAKVKPAMITAIKKARPISEPGFF